VANGSERGLAIWIRFVHLTVSLYLIDGSFENDHFSIKPVKRADPKMAVLQQMAARYIAVV